MKRIGICGGIGCGKSTVGAYLLELGAFVLDLDREMHEIYATSDELKTKIAARFGEICIKSGSVDRVALAAQVFSDPRSLGDLEKIVYPVLLKNACDKMDAAAAENPAPAIIAVEGALLFKWPEFSRKLDEIWEVTAPDSVRLERLVGRGLSKEDAERRMQVQSRDPMPPNDRIVTLENAGSLEELRNGVRRALGN